MGVKGPRTFTAIGIAATAFGTRFRLYTIVTIVLALGFGAWAGLDGPRIEEAWRPPGSGSKSAFSGTDINRGSSCVHDPLAGQEG